MPPKPAPVGRIAARGRPVLHALLLGVAGGWVFQRLQVPLAWMLGPLAFNLAAQALSVPVAIPPPLRAASHLLLGAVLGASFRPDLLARASAWPLSLAGLAAFTCAVTAATFWFYRARGMDAKTALFSAAPGVMSGMIAMGTETGGDARRITLIQSMRVAILVLLLPPLVTLGMGAAPAAAVAPAPAAGVTLAPDLLLLAAAVLACAWVLVRLRVPAAQVLGATCASAVLHAAGWVATPLPEHTLAATLLVLGAGIGGRFAGVALAEVLHTFVQTLCVVGVLLLVAAAGAAAYHYGFGLDFWAVLLAFAPGGVAEMSAIALALDVDPAFVAFHHLFRILLIIVLVPLALAVVQRTQA